MDKNWLGGGFGRGVGVLLLLMLSGSLLASMLIGLVGGAYGSVIRLQLSTLLSSVCIWLLPAILTAHVCRAGYQTVFHYQHVPRPRNMGWVILSLLCISPLISLTSGLNALLELPASLSGVERWMQESEDMARTIIDQMINGKTWTSYLSNLLIIAVAAGIAEEFFFRGILYFLLGKVIKNRHAVIWIIAFIFSAVHLQFYGFLPRMLLGAYLGYLLLSSNNIWLPVLSHILNNALVLTAMYLPPLASTTLFADTLSNTEILWMGIISLPSLFALRYCLKAIKRN